MRVYMRHLRTACWEGPWVRVWHLGVITALSTPFGVAALLLGGSIGWSRVGGALITGVGLLAIGVMYLALERRVALENGEDWHLIPREEPPAE